MIRTVHDLIDALEDCDPDMPVYLASGTRLVIRHHIRDVGEREATDTDDNGQHNGGVFLFEGEQHRTFPYVQGEA